MKNLDNFMSAYEKNLIASMKKYPEKYCWPISELESVMIRIRKAIIANSFNKDSPAFKLTCKELKIKHTYDAIHRYIKSVE